MRRMVALTSALITLVAGSRTTNPLPSAPPPADPFRGTILDGTAELDEHPLANLAIARARLGAQWLSRGVRPSGKFRYIYRPDQGRYVTTKYNAIRHAGATYALFQTYGVIGGEDVRAAAEQAARFIANNSLVAEDGGRAYAYRGISKLGGQALALVALLERRRVTSDTAHDPLIGDLARFLLSMELTDEPGRYYQSYDVSRTERLLTPNSDYYPGEALLALTRLAEHFPEGPYLAYAMRAAEYLISRRDGDLPALGEIPREDHWLTIALSELYRLSPDRAYVAVTYRQADSMLGNQYKSEDGDPWRIGGSRLRYPINYTSTATKGEALVAAWSMARFLGDEAAVIPLATGARRNVQFQMRVQYTAANTAHVRRPDRLIGAWDQDPAESYVRVDFVQHNISALVGVWQMTMQGDLPLAELPAFVR